MADVSLLDLQRWMSIIVQHPKDAATALRSRKARALIPSAVTGRGELVLPSATMQVEERLDVYNGGYLTRLLDTLRSDFPGLIHALGDEAFFDLAKGYVQQHPSQHANLIFFARHLAEFIAKQKKLPNRAFLRDLARLEGLMCESFHAKVSQGLDVNALQDLSPADWQGLVLQASPSLRLLETSYPVDHFLQAVFDQGDPEIPGRRVSYLAIYRKDYQVWRRRLSKPGYRILSSLTSGDSFGAALQHAGEAAHLIGDWFQNWSADGLFVGYNLKQTPNP